MANHRMMPPGSGPTSITVNGRTYTCAVGATIDVPDFDGAEMQANGWIVASIGGAGATANRPAAPSRGQEYHDTTLGYTVKFDGKTWRNPTNGSAV